MRRAKRKDSDIRAMVDGLRSVLFTLVPVPDGTVAFTHLSAGCERLFGVPPADLIGDCERLLARVVPEDRDCLRAALHAAAANAATCDTEFQIAAADGSSRVLMLSSSPLPEGPGCMGLLTDLAMRVERPRQDGRIARQKQIIELLHDIAAAANEAPDAESAMRDCLDRLCRHDGWPIGHVYICDDAASGRLLPSDIWHLDDPGRFAEWDACTRQLALARGEGLPGKVYESGQPIWIVDVGQCCNFLRAAMARRLGIRTGFGLPVRLGMEVVAVMEFYSTEAIPPDPLLLQALSHIGLQIGRVVERDRASRNLRVVGELAQAASRAKSNFLANMSHELRTPLNAIIGFSDAMLCEMFGPVENPRYRDYVGFIHSAGGHLLALVNDILDLSRIEARRMVLAEAEMDAGALLDICAEMVRAKAEERSISLAVAVAPGLPPVTADELRLRQVVLNLLSNAIRATAAGGSVTLAAALDLQNGLVITVTDTGCGMAADEIARTLRPFECTGPADTTRPGDGLGLGLPLSRALIELHGGLLELRSEKGVGTTATVRLPPHRMGAAAMMRAQARE